MEVVDVTAAHVVTIPELVMPRLTIQQAKIVQDFTKFNLGIPSEDMLYGHRLDMPGEAKEAFDMLRPVQDEMASFHNLNSKIWTVVLDQLYNNPFSRWDSRIDVILNGHLNHKTQAHLRVALELIDATVEFTERPGATEQTWIVINRPDPTESVLNDAIVQFGKFWKEHSNDLLFTNDQFQTQLQWTMPYSLPKRIEEEFLLWAQKMTGSGNADCQITVSVERERFKNHAPTVIVTRQFKDPGSGTYRGEQQGRDNTNHAIKVESDGYKLDHDNRGWEPK